MATAWFSYPDALSQLLNDRLKKGEFMKSIAMPRPVQVDDEIRKQLMHEVKETLATDIVFKNKKRFTTADLWHLQKSRRTASYLMSR